MHVQRPAMAIVIVVDHLNPERLVVRKKLPLQVREKRDNKIS